MISWGCSAPSCSERSLLFFLVILLGDDFDACGEGGKTIDVVAVAVGEDDCRHRFGGDLRDIVEQFLAAGFGGLRVNDDYAAGSNDDRAVAAPAFDPVDVWLELMRYKWRRWLLWCLPHRYNR